jgi:hypothetical protein
VIHRFMPWTALWRRSRAGRYQSRMAQACGFRLHNTPAARALSFDASRQSVAKVWHSRPFGCGSTGSPTAVPELVEGHDEASAVFGEATITDAEHLPAGTRRRHICIYPEVLADVEAESARLSGMSFAPTHCIISRERWWGIAYRPLQWNRTMTLEISISSDAEAKLKLRAAASGEDLPSYVAKLVTHFSEPPTPLMELSGPIYEEFKES